MVREVRVSSAAKRDRDRREIGGIELNLDHLEAVSAGNLANLRHEMQKAVANNLRA